MIFAAMTVTVVCGIDRFTPLTTQNLRIKSAQRHSTTIVNKVATIMKSALPRSTSEMIAPAIAQGMPTATDAKFRRRLARYGRLKLWVI